MQRGMAWTSRVLTVLLLATGGCAVSADVDPHGVRIMVPNPPGSGYDLTARNLARALEASSAVDGADVFNLPGAGGMVGMQRLVHEEGNPRLLMVMGLGLAGAQGQWSGDARLADCTPIARLLVEPNVVVVAQDSPFRTMADLVDAWRADPGGIVVGGGSQPGGPDHQAPLMVAQAIGIDVDEVVYEGYDGGGRLLPDIVRGQVHVAVTGYAQNATQFDSGQLRVLAVTGPARVAGLDAPTLQEVGVDVVFENWRGVLAPPGLSPAETDALGDLIVELRETPEWQETLAVNGWTDAYLPPEEFRDFLDQQVVSISGPDDG
ncbi:Bug family tripartite tricarboxylate transporter substrate binding protein [Isoptericola croceus]|uniref:Bug family tripartite tricarboxylate transporter substrate binding protein n=1 Tax=Isoptericola croceus TaxID=3031406 RepID=UPI0023F74481|nr:tripartite tricarboxylate transporter substrate binding protein [Isoptericola croceus]